jgi:thiol-disulfide isomerase/thioredoxin
MKYLLIIILIVSAFSLLQAEAMPDFRLRDMDDKNVNLESFLGKGPVIIDFWASWCNPCKVSMPYLNNLAEKYDSLTVVMVSIDAAKAVSKAKGYLKSKNYKFVGLFDCDQVLAKKLNVSTVPHTFIIDSKGNIVHSHVGFEPGTEKKYEEIILELLKVESSDE